MKFNKKYILYLFMLLFAIISNIIIFKYLHIYNRSFEITLEYGSDKEEEVQIFYNNNTHKENWIEENSIKVKYLNANKKQLIKVKIPSDSQYLRFDLGNTTGKKTFNDIKINSLRNSVILEKENIIMSNHQHEIDSMEYSKGEFTFLANGDDSYFVYILNDSIYNKLYTDIKLVNKFLQIIICIIYDIIILLLMKRINNLYDLLKCIFCNRILIFRLAKNDFKTKYAGSYLGITWAFIQPIITILIYWFVFEYGLRNGSPKEGIPYILWFISGLVPWFFIQEAISSAASSFVEYSYLVKKIVFNIDILPIVKIISSLFIHFVFLIFVLFVFLAHGNYPNIYIIQLVYYLFCTIILIIGVSFLTSSLYVFFKDLGQFIGIALQVFMWMTPILWNGDILKGNMRLIAVLNPIYYITEGYRDSLINNVWFWEKPMQTIYFMGVVLIIFVLGISIYKKLKSHFADVL